MMQIKVTKLFFNFYDDYLLKTDIKRLQQVLLNLVSNSIKFTPKAGRILIMIEKLEDRQSEMLRISVTDNGLGIKKKN